MFSIDAACFTTVLVGLFVVFRRADRRGSFPPAGWIALGMILLAEVLVYFAIPGVATVFMPIAMTAYVVAVDSAVYAVRGRSLMRTNPDAFVWIATLSIFLWVIFEIYNQSIAAWHYGGLPNNESRYLLLGWSFAMIWPAVIGTADFLRATIWPVRTEQPLAAMRPVALWAALGIACLALPAVLAHVDSGVPLFALVVLGSLALLDPLNCRAGRPSVWGHWQMLYSLLCAGTICGITWGFWNVRAAARVYSTSAEVSLFELTLASFLPMALFGPAAFAVYVFIASRLNLPVYDLDATRE